MGGGGDEVVNINLKAMGGKWRPGPGPTATKTDVERGQTLQLSPRASGLCCVTPRLGDPSCPALASSCPGNQRPVIHPELPFPWSGGETADPLVEAGIATTLSSLQCSGGGAGWPTVLWVWCRMAAVAHCWAGLPHCGRAGGRVTP